MTQNQKKEFAIKLKKKCRHVIDDFIRSNPKPDKLKRFYRISNIFNFIESLTEKEVGIFFNHLLRKIMPKLRWELDHLEDEERVYLESYDSVSKFLDKLEQKYGKSKDK